MYDRVILGLVIGVAAFIFFAIKKEPLTHKMRYSSGAIGIAVSIFGLALNSWSFEKFLTMPYLSGIASATIVFAIASSFGKVGS